MLRKAAVIFLVFLAGFSFPASTDYNADDRETAELGVRIYKNSGCGHCVPYIEELAEMLLKNGYSDITITDYLSDDDARKEVFEINKRFGVPLQMQGHMLVLIGEDYLFQGHVPVNLIEGYLKNPRGKVVVTQDSMDKPTTYQMLDGGRVYACSLDTPLEECAFRGSGGTFDNAQQPQQLDLLVFGLLAIGGAAAIYALRGK